MSAARDRIITALQNAGAKVTNSGSASTCPAHDDNAPSLSIGDRDAKDGVVIRCHAGCTTGAVLDALGLKPADLFDEQKQKQERAQVVATYPYVDEHGTVLFEKLRYVPKTFRQKAADGSWTLKGVRRVLYRLPEVVDAIRDGRPVYVAEGEKDADALAAAGVTATCWTEGAWKAGQSAKWRPEYTQQLAGAQVVIVADRDEPGMHTASTIAAELEPVAASVQIVQATAGKDAADHLAAGHTVDELEPLNANSDVEDKVTWQPGDGAALLDEIEAMLSKFVAFPSDETRLATVLWIAHTHALDAFDTTARLAFLSPEPGSGKTRALEIVEMLVHNPILTVNATPAYLIRRLSDEDRPVLLFDEIDTVFGPRAKADNEDVRGLINSGYRAGATSGRCVIKGKNVETEDFPSFAAVAMAGLDDLPDTIATRAVIVRMRRRSPKERVSPYRRRLHEPAGHELRDRLRQWVTSHAADLADAWPEMPEGIEDRDADVWEPLIAIADLAGGRWPELARVSAVSLVSLSQVGRGGLGIRLLEDTRAVFADADHIGTAELIDALHALEEAPWESLKGHGLDARGLAWRLGKYGIKPRQIKAINRKGYSRADLADAWERYLPEPTTQADEVPSGLGGGGDLSIYTPYVAVDSEAGSLPVRKGETAETTETTPTEPPEPSDAPIACAVPKCTDTVSPFRVEHGHRTCSNHDSRTSDIYDRKAVAR